MAQWHIGAWKNSRRKVQIFNPNTQAFDSEHSTPITLSLSVPLSREAPVSQSQTNQCTFTYTHPVLQLSFSHPYCRSFHILPVFIYPSIHHFWSGWVSLMTRPGCRGFLAGSYTGQLFLGTKDRQRKWERGTKTVPDTQGSNQPHH